MHIGAKVDLRITAPTLEIYAAPSRSPVLLTEGAAGEYRTNAADLPTGERFQQWDGARTRAWAERIGPAAQIVTDRIFESVPINEQGLDAALALTGPVRSPRYAHVQPILATGQDKTAALRPTREEPDEVGGNVRGTDYYARGAP